MLAMVSVPFVRKHARREPLVEAAA
jgi:hypothetical protein